MCLFNCLLYGVQFNSLNEFSYKSRIKNSKNISILVAFNITTKDVICSLPYSGNCVDITSFPDFLEKTNIKKGIIIGDKGLNSGTGIENVGYIFPVKRSLKILKIFNDANLPVGEPLLSRSRHMKTSIMKQGKTGNFGRKEKTENFEMTSEEKKSGVDPEKYEFLRQQYEFLKKISEMEKN